MSEKEQAAEARDALNVLERAYTTGAQEALDDSPEAFTVLEGFVADFDALSVRLAQECALRAQAEQDVSLLRRERDEAKKRSVGNGKALCRMRSERDELEVRLRVTDALKREYEEALAEIESKPYRAEEVVARFRAASGGREALKEQT